jgi:hypothetical protein
MALKKYTDFSEESKIPHTSSLDEKKVTKKVVPTPSKKVEKPVVPISTKTPAKPVCIKNESKIVFSGKVAKFPTIKPSQAIKLLENKNVSKEKLDYIITDQNDTIVIVKYNENAKFDLKKFSDALISFYRNNSYLKENFSKVIVEGCDKYSIIRNIPDIDYNDKKMIQVVNDDITKLLSR